MKLSNIDFPAIIYNLDNLALEKGYSKIFAKVPAMQKKSLLRTVILLKHLFPNFSMDVKMFILWENILINQGCLMQGLKK